MARQTLGLVAAVCLVCCAHAAEVSELGDPNRNDAANAEMDAGQAGLTSRPNQMLNMPGPAYGNPGYKESHNWESDVDIYSPVIFNKQFYAAKYALADHNEAAIKADWKGTGLAADLVAPNCRQATADFSLNVYADNNPTAVESSGGSCAKLLEQYMNQGLFDGLSGATNQKVLYQGKSDFGVQKQELDTDMVGKDNITPSQQYTLSFWIKLNDAMAVDSNILHYGDAEFKRSPAIYAKAGTTNLKFSVSQTNEQDFHCSLDGDGSIEQGALAKKTWYGISLVVDTNGAKVYVNGKERSACTNPDGTTVTPPEGTHFYTSDPWSEPARAEIQGLTYYPKYMMTESEVLAQSEIEKASLK